MKPIFRGVSGLGFAAGMVLVSVLGLADAKKPKPSANQNPGLAKAPTFTGPDWKVHARGLAKVGGPPAAWYFVVTNVGHTASPQTSLVFACRQKFPPNKWVDVLCSPWGVSVPSLAPGQTWFGNSPYHPASGYQIAGTVDPSNLIREESELNNTATVKRE